MITQEELQKLYKYDPDTGEFRHAQKRRGVRNMDKPVGTVDNGYVKLRVNNELHRAHRLAWLHHNGVISEQDVIDHIDHNKLNNAIKNLRQVNRSQNSKNLSKFKTNTSGHAGVFQDRGKWRAKITVDGKTKYLGTYKDKDSALKARIKAAKEHNFHENHGK
jgi:hypothetical protein